MESTQKTGYAFALAYFSLARIADAIFHTYVQN